MPKINRQKMIATSFRLPADLLERAKDKAAREEKTLSDVIRVALERYAGTK